MKIKNVTLKTPYILAPMAGYTDCAFRSLCSEFGCGLTTTEMVSAKGLLYGSEGSQALLYREPNEKPAAVQIFSNEPEVVRDVLQKGILDSWNIIDINMGCPMPKIVKEGMGSALMLDLPTASAVIKSAVDNSKKPVTVKFRLGFDKRNINAVDFAKMCQDSGASAICVHGRTRTQMYEGQADWEVIGQVVQAVKIPVFGNGDIQNKIQADDMMEKYGCAGVAVGRGALGKPWIFSEMLGKDIDVDTPQIIKKHFSILQKHFSEKLILLHMRKHLAYYINGVPKAKSIRHKLVTSNSLVEIFSIIDELFKK